MWRFLLGPLLAWAKGLRFPWLLALTAACFTATLVVPDPLPFLDEIVLALATLVFANLKQRHGLPADKADTTE